MLASTTTTYTVVLRTGDGRTHTLDVDGKLYERATKGASVTVDSWHGRIKRIAIGGRTHDQWSYWRIGAAWMMAWTGVMLIIGWALPIDGNVIGFAVGAWWVGFMAYGVFSGYWGPAWYVLPATFGGVVLFTRVCLAATSRRYARGRGWR